MPDSDFIFIVINHELILPRGSGIFMISLTLSNIPTHDSSVNLRSCPSMPSRLGVFVLYKCCCIAVILQDKTYRDYLERKTNNTLDNPFIDRSLFLTLYSTDIYFDTSTIDSF